MYPPVYEQWLGERLKGLVREVSATCENCVMVHPQGLTRDIGPFKENLKCCTYFPFIPNFSLGAMREAGTESFDLRYAAAGSQGLLLPVGLYPTPERQQQMEERREEFGQRADLLCPFFDARQKGCSIWSHRPAVCTTYFCKSDYNEEGFELWADVEDVLNHFEWVMATEIFARLGLDEVEMQACRDLMQTSGGAERERLVEIAWGAWRGREEDFYLESWRQAQAISATEVGELMGDEASELAADLRRRAAMLSLRP